VASTGPRPSLSSLPEVRGSPAPMGPAAESPTCGSHRPSERPGPFCCAVDPPIQKPNETKAANGQGLPAAAGKTVRCLGEDWICRPPAAQSQPGHIRRFRAQPQDRRDLGGKTLDFLFSKLRAAFIAIKAPGPTWGMSGFTGVAMAGPWLCPRVFIT